MNIFRKDGDSKVKKQYVIKKLDEDDILEILIEHFQDDELRNYMRAQACLLGKPGEELRFIGVFSNDDSATLQHDFKKLDKEIDYNGDHSFLENNLEFQIQPMDKNGDFYRES